KTQLPFLAASAHVLPRRLCRGIYDDPKIFFKLNFLKILTIKIIFNSRIPMTNMHDLTLVNIKEHLPVS
ncbi:hypothetical protein, partial [Salmonella sp. s54395]|uniref:hypothetical protein n=1 Tax=Salmonella sp. s54395 TaxID=3159664 RepID=UPI0039809076